MLKFENLWQFFFKNKFAKLSWYEIIDTDTDTYNDKSFNYKAVEIHMLINLFIKLFRILHWIKSYLLMCPKAFKNEMSLQSHAYLEFD